MAVGHSHKKEVVVAGSGGRLDRVLSQHSELSRTRLKALIQDGAVTVGPRTIRDPGYRVNAGDIAVAVPPPEPATPQGESIPLNIVYEDDEIVVIDKPAGLVVHPAAGHAAGTLVNALIAHCGDSLSGIGGVKRPGIVHRLDKDTSGLMVAGDIAAPPHIAVRDRGKTPVPRGSGGASGMKSGGRDPRNRSAGRRCREANCPTRHR
jgi:23S rRNA-/tRNA-specific pseudouridylate synthase